MVEEDGGILDVIKESQMMLEWASDQTMGITTTAVEQELKL